jgi:flagellar M-ring protein FliF
VQGSVVAAAPGTPPLLQKEGSPVYPQASGLGQSVREESGTYAVTRHLVHSESGPGRLQRVTAAVVVNDRYFAEPAGKSGYIWKPRTPEEMHRLEGLAQAAVGFDEKRGDQVVMENVSFSSNAPEQKLGGFEKVVEEMKGLLGQQPGMFRTRSPSGAVRAAARSRTSCGYTAGSGPAHRRLRSQRTCPPVALPRRRTRATRFGTECGHTKLA